MEKINQEKNELKEKLDDLIEKIQNLEKEGNLQKSSI